LGISLGLRRWEYISFSSCIKHFSVSGQYKKNEWAISGITGEELRINFRAFAYSLSLIFSANTICAAINTPLIDKAWRRKTICEISFSKLSSPLYLCAKSNAAPIIFAVG
jgi:hypothetical protein